MEPAVDLEKLAGPARKVLDPSAPAQTYTNWVFTIDGTDHDQWNRFANANVTWDFVPATPTRHERSA